MSDLDPEERALFEETRRARDSWAEKQDWSEPEPEPDLGVCEVCGAPVPNQDLLDLSRIRFRKAMCQRCFDVARGRLVR